ncbi:protein LURP-one-related 15-like [Dendrobium catenatum]|uniref:Protein LURP-one-related 15 n=1 Tax=Dendrobium catenatum TaxID=906689 RepID=A0A2I0WUJ0_9ASPA|nr:protein LURP-one-related 15-like [Dendrobium catenatum]PKU79330.1 Protein LURP-one-related 15 [Dendrobium catenatum]
MDSSQVAVINPLFYAAYPIDLAFTTKPPGDKKRGGLATVDAAGNVVFRANKSSWGGFTQLRDASGHTILTVQDKFWSWHSRWQAFAGESTEAKDLLFSIKRSSAWKIHDEWFVFLAVNTKEENCDFKIVGSYSKKNYTIFKGDSSFVVAQLTKQHELKMTLKHAFGASISANCDYSFVAALITIFHEIDATRNVATWNATARNASRNAAARNSAMMGSTGGPASF